MTDHQPTQPSTSERYAVVLDVVTAHHERGTSEARVTDALLSLVTDEAGRQMVRDAIAATYAQRTYMVRATSVRRVTEGGEGVAL